MSEYVKPGHDWEHLYTQFKNANKDRVLCLMHKKTREFIYFDVKLNRLLSKREAMAYRLDVTGLHVIAAKPLIGS